MRSDGPRRWPAAALAAGTVMLFALAATVLSRQTATGRWFIDWPLRLWGVAAVGPGVVVWLRAASPRLGQLMVAAAGTYYLNYLRGSEQPVVFAVGFCLAYLWVGLVAHLVLTWPVGRITDRAQRVMVPLCYAAPVGSQVVRYLVDRPRPPWGFGIPQPNTLAAQAGSALFALLALITVVILVRRWAVASRLRRRPGAPVWGAVVLACLLGVGVSLASMLSPTLWLEIPLLVVALCAGLFLVPAVYGLQRQRAGWARRGLADVALGLWVHGDPTTVDPPRLQQALADAVGDPTLRLIYHLADESYVDIAGRVVAPPQPSAGRALSSVFRRGRLFALIEHDEALGDEGGVAEATIAAAGLAIENAHLYATLQAHIEQIRNSRLRLATAAFEERRRIQRDLHDGAQQRLFAVLVLLDMARHQLGGDGESIDLPRRTLQRAHEGLQDAIQALRELTENIYPVALAEHGLAHAVESMADLSAVPLTVDIDRRRWRPEVENAAYFVIAEGLTNVARHAGATRAGVTVSAAAGYLTVEVVDDGRGNARPLAGHGLSGLQDRVAVVGGTLSVGPATGTDSGPVRGTRLVARLPLEE
ncbi:sensor histidine kinase [Plantactinospora endophytica]|uniref:histidine kinase n=1 Tax=Plantactinospora endophytica TaxID=673535 RepID=A0ABQ4E7G1_9ACTN|nr:sensor histidine kinase [Plantactinospora endophytica]GIG90652.1 hypothetical protein Pen02_55880 [Plantactinospora endophytica]